MRLLQVLADKIGAPIAAGLLLTLILIALGLNAVVGPAPNGGGGDRVQVAYVYNVPSESGLATLRQQGFKNIRVIKVCSNSVSAGRIREVLLDDGSSVTNETVFVGPAGPKPIEILLSTKLLVKVSNGNGCS